MRFVLAVIAALASSIFAMPADVTGTAKCPTVCYSDADCKDCYSLPCMSTVFFLGSNLDDMLVIHLHRTSLRAACETCFCFHIGAVRPLALMRVLLVICRSDQRGVRKTLVDLV
ncbi:hypothetical protein DFJ58DRAFT_824911 [Suillus subalutaceus]|uniref:uncharacterized protein n=1 Tax=Suillus subalutaceus TaxID=48586 RepID=UPI001B85E15A|nr:uncharacterized protein DFJ58DRAFT_824911 [Suillus subalutaceus]KAG1830273.1 hypothetical protein DFJ58DRAFT_824911 [Suillus subalutaceus]